MNDILKFFVYAGIFLVPFVVLLVTSSMFFPFITGKNFAFRMLVEIMFAAWILLALLDTKYRPKFSWIMVAGIGFLIVMFFANLFGEYPAKSFWSNYERMEGYVTLVHFFIYFLVVGTMLTTEKLWNRFFNTTLVVAVMLSFYAFAQFSGSAEVSQGGSWRLDGTLGNSTYMAVYMLFHIFIAAMMLVRTKSNQMRYVYGALIALFVFLLLQTGTRGATLGLFGGGFLTALYIALFASGHATLRKIAAGGLLALVLLAGVFMAARDSAFVQSTLVLDRIADISLESGNIRFMVWDLAFEGIQERPLLGWGQENFNYVFNTYYDPGLYIAEAWYDRAHNVILDWFIAGGVIGGVFYLSLFGAALYYVIVRPLVAYFRKVPENKMEFSVVERGLLLGILSAYVFHNLFVFDNIISYIFFAVVLAFIHSRIATDIPWLEGMKIDRRVVEQVAAPVVGVVLLATLYFVNIPSMLAANDIIDAFRSQNYDARFEAFERAFDRDTLGNQEIAEQISQQAMELATQNSVSAEMKGQHLPFAEETMLTMIERQPGNARLHLFLSGLYGAEGDLEEAKRQMAITRELTPNKPTVIIEQGVLELRTGDTAQAHEFFTTAYELAPEFAQARIAYMGSLFFVGETDQLAELITEEYMMEFARHQIVLLAISQNNLIDTVDAYFTSYVAEHPDSVTARTAHALLHSNLNNNDRAIEILESAAQVHEEFAETADCYIKNIEDEE
ncbi:MAG: O-antigen ligase family protein, partial [Candidatus Paceibacterota bacterium]